MSLCWSKMCIRDSFNTSNRNNNQQFALLFTPLAQESMLKLLEDREAGYGDDFDFDKNKMINTITPNHMQELNLDMNPDQYRHFDYDKAKADFYTINARYFRAIYFSLAPLLCVPIYQQIRPLSDIYGRDMQRHSSFWEHEALANFWGQDHFKHPSCVTDCILNTEQTQGRDDSSTTVSYTHLCSCAVYCWPLESRRKIFVLPPHQPPLAMVLIQRRKNSRCVSLLPASQGCRNNK